MANQLTSNAEALRLFFTEEVFLVKDEIQGASAEPVVDSKLTALPPAQPKESTPQPAAPVLPIAIPSDALSSPTKKNWNFTFLGKNQKQILILVNDDVNPVSSKEGTELLRNLVKAINLTNNDFALVNYAQYSGAKYEDLSLVFKCQLLLSFGVGHEQLGLNPQPLHQLSNLGSTRMIFTTNLHGLHQDNPSKKMLWATLQQIKG